jgi:hypothetical protein
VSDMFEKVFRPDGAPVTVTMFVKRNDDGSLICGAHDIANRGSGLEDRETTITFKAEALPTLAYAMLCDAFSKSPTATTHLLNLCRDNGVDVSWQHWPY